ncbi:hypothetical protein N1851_031279 [Merluccius polli]|uniref:Uncharacterized protein n=1 Tax=Merluccius polli TaxID=89951 RepID=A0AA47NP94_MERPO|nr:hypothetical protein N1851_031279 [Merluccius polli]
MTHLSLKGVLLVILLCDFLGGLCAHHEPCESHGYNRDFLLLMWYLHRGAVDPSAVIPTEIIRLDPSTGDRSWTARPAGVRERGRRGGVRQRIKRQGLRRIPLPTVILANVQSLRSKMDELQAKVKFLTEFKSVCLLAFRVMA